jgi:hypothetical protein
MNTLGINLIVVSWWGMRPYDLAQQAPVDEAVRTLYSVANASFPNIKIAIMVEGFNESGTYDFPYIKSYIYSNFYSAYPNEMFYLKDSPRPLLCWWNAKNMTGPDEAPNWTNINAIHNDATFENKILGQSSSYVDWYAWTPCSANSSETPFINTNDGVVVIEPRYDGSNIGQGAGSTFDLTYSERLYDRQWSYVLNNTEKIECVLIYSWNEYHERSQIEPCNQTLDQSYDPYYCYRKTLNYINLYQSTLCDLNHDLRVDMNDIASAAVCFGLRAGYPKWNPRADVTGDGVVDIRDIVAIARHFGKHYP